MPLDLNGGSGLTRLSCRAGGLLPPRTRQLGHGRESMWEWDDGYHGNVSRRSGIGASEISIGYRSRLLSAFGVLATGGRDAPSKVLGSLGRFGGQIGNIGQEEAYETTIDDFRRRCRIGLQPGATAGTVGAGLSIGVLHGYCGELLACHATLQWRRVDRGRPTRASRDGLVPTVGHPEE